MIPETQWQLNLKFNYLSLNILICTFPLLTVVIIIFLKDRYRDKLLRNRIPTRKLPLLNFLGHFMDAPKGDAILKDLPSSLYFFQLVCGYWHLFKNQSLMGFWVAHSYHILLMKANAVEELLKSTEILRKSWTYSFLHPWLGTGLLTSEGSKWKSRRKLLTPSFHFDILKNFLPVFNEQSQVLVDILKEQLNEPWIDLHHVVTLCSLDIICETTLGIKVQAQRNNDSQYVQSVLRVSKAILERLLKPSLWLDVIFYNTALGRQFKNDLRVLHDFTINIIQRKKKDLKSNEMTKIKRKALMDLLLEQNMFNGSLTDEDVREEIDTFAFEGHDTTSAGLTWSLYLIGLHPDVQSKISEELYAIFEGDDRFATADDLRAMKYLECALKESQRLYPSVPVIERELDSEKSLCGYTVPKGTVVVVNNFMLHRDATVFPNPEVFDPDRFELDQVKNRHPFAYVPFSAGPRNCIGQKFAMMELKTVVSTVLRKYVIKSLDHRDKVLYSCDLILRPIVPIRVKLSPRG